MVNTETADAPLDPVDTMDLVGLGVSTLDVLALVDEFPTGDFVQRAQDVAVAGGGPVATACAAAARLGARVAVIDATGDDWIGLRIVRSLAEAGVDCSHINTIAGCRSPLASVLVERGSGRRAIAFHAGTTPLRRLDAPDRGLIAGSRCLHVNGRHWPTCLEAAALAREAGTWVSFDGGADRFDDDHRALVALSDVCVVARSYARDLTGETEPMDQLRAMGRQASGIVGVTDGVHGSWLAGPTTTPFRQPAFRLSSLVDTTGCGDAYHGALLFAILRGASLPDAARLASAVAALASRALGGRDGLPTLPETDRFLADRATTHGRVCPA